MITRIGLATAALSVLGFTALPGLALAGSRTNVSQGLTAQGVPLAMHGYDAVEYFTEGKAVIGEAAHAAVYDGAAYRFVSEKNKAAFEKNPEQFVPAYGGFCAYGVAVGAKFDGDPRLFSVIEGRLYFNLNPEIQMKWNEDIAGYIEMADGNWLVIRDKEPMELTE